MPRPLRSRQSLFVQTSIRETTIGDVACPEVSTTTFNEHADGTVNSRTMSSSDTTLLVFDMVPVPMNPDSSLSRPAVEISVGSDART